LKCAIFLEQAALCFSQCTVPMKRKHAMHLVLAGHRYLKCEQNVYAQRCYDLAAQYYHGKNWTLIDDHLNFSLGKHSSQMGNVEKSLIHFKHLLHKSRQNSSNQRTYLSQFLYTYQQYAINATKEQLLEFNNLSLPVVNFSKVEIISKDAVLAQVEASNLTENSKFTELEADLYKELEHKPDKKMDQSAVCAVGETLVISILMENPLRVPLPVNNVFLELEFNGKHLMRQLVLDASKELPPLLEFPELNVQVLPDVSLDSLETKNVTVSHLDSVTNISQGYRSTKYSRASLSFVRAY